MCIRDRARYSNNGSYPPDLSVITKTKKNGPDYIYNLLIGYTDPPEDFELAEGMYYNIWKEGYQIAMAQPLDEGYVDYDDGTENSLPQLSKDITNFLVWAAEPELEERKRMGIKVLLFFIIAAIGISGYWDLNPIPLANAMTIIIFSVVSFLISSNDPSLGNWLGDTMPKNLHGTSFAFMYGLGQIIGSFSGSLAGVLLNYFSTTVYFRTLSIPLILASIVIFYWYKSISSK